MTESSSRNLPRRLYFDKILPPEDLFQNRLTPGDYILKQSLRARDYFIPRNKLSSPEESLFRRELGYSHIAFIANQSTLFWLTHFYPSYMHCFHQVINRISSDLNFSRITQYIAGNLNLLISSGLALSVNQLVWGLRLISFPPPQQHTP